MNYSDQICEWLLDEGYSHCFFVAGGNIMHLLDSARTRFECVPFVHEVAAGIAAEYFNEARPAQAGRAFALVTAGPGLTNIVTALAGAYLESRELLVIGGQVKASDLARGAVRQRGIQEVDGVALASPVSKEAVQVERPISREEFIGVMRAAHTDRPGPVFIEICLDAQGAAAIEVNPSDRVGVDASPVERPKRLPDAVAMLAQAQRPILLIGGGVSRNQTLPVIEAAREARIPCATTWNGADRVPADDPLYAGRPNTWGMRWANLVLQQADVVIAAGTRLGLQQTGFNWQEFAPVGRVIHIDIDSAELEKGHPHTEVAIQGDVNVLLPQLLQEAQGFTAEDTFALRGRWMRFIQNVRQEIPLSDPANETADEYLDPFDFIQELSTHISSDSVIVPCSSGGAFTVSMQALFNRQEQLIITNKGLASMGYGLSGAIGAALANRGRMTVLIEGDGGFAQNLQELGTLVAQNLNVKLFLFANEGYASIRMTQRNYFGGAYVGCDVSTGLGMPSWSVLFSAYGIPSMTLSHQDAFNADFHFLLQKQGPAAIIVPIDPEQTYYPKIASHVTSEGSMVSSPIHMMSPDLDPQLLSRVTPYLQHHKRDQG
jgi:acetolactate synthase-1/2/3 large subunit